MPPPTPKTPMSARFFTPSDDDLPVIDSSESFTEVVDKLTNYFVRCIDASYTYEQLRTTFAGQSLKPLILKLSEDCHHPALVAALLAAKYDFSSQDDFGTGLNESRGLACEIVAWQFLTFLMEKELIDYLLYELPQPVSSSRPSTPSRSVSTHHQDVSNENHHERSPLLAPNEIESGHESAPPVQRTLFTPMRDTDGTLGLDSPSETDELAKAMAGMNALEIAAIANAKRFLSQRPVQKIVDDIWDGNIIFWESLSVGAVKKPRTYNKRVADPFTRLRVPKYQKTFQVAFFVSFLALYYAVLVQRNPNQVTFTEVLLYMWIAGYAYDEFGELQDAGVLFYRIDFWSLWDLAIILVSAAFVAARIAGLALGSDRIVDIAFDILSMVALFLVPRIFSVMSLNSYFGSLIPVLKEMTKTFCKFLPVIVVLYLGFLTTFTMLARDKLTLSEMSWILIKVFFGSSYLGFDTAYKISDVLGYPLMLIFVTLTNILLLTALVSLVSNSLSEVMAHAREEHLFQYSIYVLESSTSRRLTYFVPPLNLIPLLLLRPLRLVLPSDSVRRIRIFALKATHIGFVALIWAYESSQQAVSRGSQPPSSRSGRVFLSTPRPHSATWDREREQPRPSAKTTLAKPNLELDPTKPASTMANVELLDLVQQLSAQLTDLTALVAGQKEN